MSNPMPNPFDPNSVAQTPGSVLTDTAGVSPPPPDTSAGQLESDGVGAKHILASSPSEEAAVSIRTAAASDITRLTHNPVTQAVEVRPLHVPIAHVRTVATDLSDWDINGSENIHEIFAYARKLCREQSPDIENHRFAPNYSGMFHAAVNEEVWDDPPSFLRSVR